MKVKGLENFANISMCCAWGQGGWLGGGDKIFVSIAGYMSQTSTSLCAQSRYKTGHKPNYSDIGGLASEKKYLKGNSDNKR
jgi:hypothetical protein